MRYSSCPTQPPCLRCTKRPRWILEYDEDRALSRKYMWALSHIRTEEAIAALEKLSRSSNDRSLAGGAASGQGSQ